MDCNKRARSYTWYKTLDGQISAPSEIIMWGEGWGWDDCAVRVYVGQAPSNAQQDSGLTYDPPYWLLDTGNNSWSAHPGPQTASV